MPTLSRLGTFMDAHGVSTSTLARESGYCRQHIRRLRLARAEPTRRTMIAVAKGLSVILDRHVTLWEAFDINEDETIRELFAIVNELRALLAKYV